MKTLQKGKPQDGKPWVGKVIECGDCNFSGKLQSGDKVRHIRRPKKEERVEAPCPNCRKKMILRPFPYKTFSRES